MTKEKVDRRKRSAETIQAEKAFMLQHGIGYEPLRRAGGIERFLAMKPEARAFMLAKMRRDHPKHDTKSKASKWTT